MNVQTTTTWTVNPLAMELHWQIANTDCGPACAQMILSVMGYAGKAPGAWQSALQQLMATMPLEPNFPFAGPAHLAAVVTTPPPPLPAPSAAIVPPRPYDVVRAATPDPACAAAVDALSTFAVPSAVLVLKGGHWVVVYGGSGLGQPGQATFSIVSLRMCNPDDGYFGGIPGGRPRHGPPLNYIDEVIAYGEFCRTYFTPAREYGGVNPYAVVTDKRVAAHISAPPAAAMPAPAPAPTPARMSAPPALDAAEPAVPPSASIESAIEALRRTSVGEVLADTEQGRPRLVRRLDDGTAYYLVPFVRRDGFADVLRLDQRGAYLGTAFAIPYSDLYLDEGAASIARAAFGDRYTGRGGASARPERDLVWAPSIESRTAYNPFYRFRSGNDTAYVSLGGRPVKDLHDLLTYVPLKFE